MMNNKRREPAKKVTKNMPLTDEQKDLLLTIKPVDIGKYFNRKKFSREFLLKERKKLLDRDRRFTIAAIKQDTTDSAFQKKYNILLADYAYLKREHEALLKTSESVKPYKIKAGKTGKKGGELNEGVAVLMWGDWHIEEVVTRESVNGFNEHNLLTGFEREQNVARNSLRLIQLHQKNLAIKRVILHLQGDFISGNIHEDIKAMTELEPIEAVAEAQRRLISCIDYLLQNGNFEIIAVCSPGNHSRITKEKRIATCHGNSLEYGMYLALKNYYSGNQKISFVIQKSYHTYLKVFDKTLRFHHGDSFRYQGGIGGIYVPVKRKIAQWNKGPQKADLDVFGHWHQLLFDPSFICNGSIIGYSPFSIEIGGEYQDPQQGFFIIDAKRGVTIRTQISVK